MNAQQIQSTVVDKEAAKSLALEQLVWLRQPSDTYQTSYEIVLEQMKVADLSFEDLGTSQAEIDSLVRQGKKALAIDHLEWLGRGDRDYAYKIEKIRQIVLECGYTLADFGTNEAQLAKFTKAGAKVAAQYWLQKFKEGDPNALTRIFAELSQARLSLFGLNTSAKMRSVLNGQSVRKQPAQNTNPGRPNVTIREITAADAKRLQWKSQHPGLSFGDSSLELFAEAINRHAAERPGTRYFKLSWVGDNVPQGAIVLDQTISWTQNSRVVSDKRVLIGSYIRLVRFGGLFNNQHVIVVLLFPGQE